MHNRTSRVLAAVGQQGQGQGQAQRLEEVPGPSQDTMRRVWNDQDQGPAHTARAAEMTPMDTAGKWLQALMHPRPRGSIVERQIGLRELRRPLTAVAGSA